MAEFYTYTKKRKEFGTRPIDFKEAEVVQCGYIPSNNEQRQGFQYEKRDPNFIMLDNIVEQSEHRVNTESVKTSDKGMFHKEGGWPDKIDPTEPTDTTKYKKKIEKDQNFMTSVKELCSAVENCIKKNNYIDLFEEYFQNEQSEHVVENLSSKTLMLFKDDSAVQKRAVSEISWYPEGPQKLAVAYSVQRFQQMNEKMPTQAYIWDVNNPNNYDKVLKSPSSVTKIQYNPKLIDIIGGGCYSGLVAFWDVRRKESEPTHTSPIEKSHYDPITSFNWLSTKGNSECITSSTDGRVLWWDLRRLDQGPTEILDIKETTDSTATIGGTIMEYNIEAGPNKFLIGTEQGSILLANKRPKKDLEIQTRYGVEAGRHLGPVYSVKRSSQNPKYFLSIGDWSAKVWQDDLKVPIIRTKYHGAYLSDGCFSPTRPGVFFLTRRDGWMDVWDYYYRQNEIAYSHKVSDSPLTCLKINVNSGPGHHNIPTGKLVAVGDQEGTVTLLELCDSLYMQQPKEKDIINEMFERELRKEKNLEAIKRQQDLAKKATKPENTAVKEKWERKKQELINDAEEKFNKMIEEASKNQIVEEYGDLDSPQFKNKPHDNNDPHDQ